jgi:hypothetical protein
MGDIDILAAHQSVTLLRLPDHLIVVDGGYAVSNSARHIVASELASQSGRRLPSPGARSRTSPGSGTPGCGAGRDDAERRLLNTLNDTRLL